MTKRYEQSILINKEPAAVFDFLAVPSNHATFVPGLVEFDTEPPGLEWAVGVQAEGKHKVVGRTVTATGVMVEKVPGERIVWDNKLMGINSRGTWSVAAAEGGSRVTLVAEMEQNMLTRLLSNLGFADVDKAQAKVLNALKQKLESV